MPGPDPHTEDRQANVPDPAPPAWGGGTRARRRPRLAPVLGLLALWVFVSSLALLPGHAGGLGFAPIPQALAALLLLTCIAVFRWSDAGLGRPQPGSWRLMWLPWLYLPLFAAVIWALGPPPTGALITLTALMIWVALSEEVMFRGLLFPALRQHLRIWPAIWVTTLAFAAIHLGNGLITGDYPGAVVQSLAAVSTGLLLLAVRLRRGSIRPAILYHLLWNVGAFGLDLAEQTQGAPVVAQAGPVLLLVPLALVVPNGLYALWLLRDAGRVRLPGDPGGV
ncbi:MAG: lysostaphin resistance A-like protein [Pararhodobacter sp.]